MEKILKHHLEQILPYRLYALDIFRKALSFVEQYPQGGEFNCSVEGKIKFQGNSYGFTNPSIEMGIIHARVLLEFLGLKAQSQQTKLFEESNPRQSDIHIGRYGLDRVTIVKAVEPYTGQKFIAEQALAETITAANKLVAHSTEKINLDPKNIEWYLITCKAIPVLFNLYFYQPLKLKMPNIELKKYSQAELSINLFEKLAKNTWSRLEDGFRLGISQGEETITDINLLEIYQSGHNNIRAIKTPKLKESKIGTDWEWWIGSDTRWFRFAVQAKKTPRPSGKYYNIQQKVNNTPQVNILKKYALINGAIPLYCF